MPNPKRPRTPCLECGAEPKRRENVYCSMQCSGLHRRKTKFYEDPKPRNVRGYLLATRAHQCEVCGRKTWMGSPIPIEVDHVDGDSENNVEGNLRLICPNCHAQTPTWKNKNKGKGRAVRRARYADGKSF